MESELPFEPAIDRRTRRKYFEGCAEILEMCKSQRIAGLSELERVKLAAIDITDLDIVIVDEADEQDADEFFEDEDESLRLGFRIAISCTIKDSKPHDDSPRVERCVMVPFSEKTSLDMIWDLADPVRIAVAKVISRRYYRRILTPNYRRMERDDWEKAQEYLSESQDELSRVYRLLAPEKHEDDQE